MNLRVELAVLSVLGVLFLIGCGQEKYSDLQATPVQEEQSQNALPAGLPDKFFPDVAAYPCTGSISKKIVHRRGCPLIKSIPAADRENFRAFGIARKAGYKPCKSCRPDKGGN